MNEERYILFDQYLQGEMTVEERNSFEKEVSENPEFAAEFITFKNVQVQLENKFGHEQEREAFIENLSDIADKHFNKDRPKVVLMRPWYYAAAASVAILFGLFFFDYNQNPSFNDYNHPGQAHFTERSNTNESLIQAEKTFNERKFKEAIPFLEAVLKENKTSEIQYYYGVSLLQTGQDKESEAVFNELKSGSSVYKEKALWNLALLKLKQKDYNGCKEILETISQDYEDYDEVQELLHALD
ncbi:tetratricopeptide repeat protein [Flavobacterium pectinovorum]|uniref:tetratricopeptide repeat protein n=1 Tax=Flavobacterium pectinovorum TaxID=29533 RepID=UPI001FABB324|nr:tetratricopeptide repeat protein [Flavobacterium pectinovorum]MCI9845278.1 tetratricopeptide repeat protein [Flavobacterium pectinovorum]